MIALNNTCTFETYKWVSNSQNAGCLGWFASIILIVFAYPSIAWAQSGSSVLVEPQKTKYLAGEKLDRRNLQALSVWWKDAKLRDRLMAFSETQDIAIMLDRRIDPSTIVNLGVENRTVDQVFRRISSAAKIGVCRIEDCYYFGPVDTTIALPIAIDTLARQAKKVARRSPVKWTVKRRVRTEPVVATKALIQAIATKHGFVVNGLDELPHDLWYSVSLPPTSVIGQIQLMLAGFDKSFKIDPNGKSITIIDFPKTESAKRNFSVAKRPANSKELSAQFPDLRISYRSKAVSATGPPQQLAQLEAALSEQVEPKANQKNVRLTLKAESDRLTVLRSIAETAKLELVLGEITPAELSGRIKIDAVEVTQSELIFEALKGTRFRAEVVDDKLIVRQ